MDELNLKYNHFYEHINDVLTGLPAESINKIYKVDNQSTLYTSKDGTVVFVSFRNNGAYIASNKKHFVNNDSQPRKVYLEFD